MTITSIRSSIAVATVLFFGVFIAADLEARGRGGGGFSRGGGGFGGGFSRGGIASGGGFSSRGASRGFGAQKASSVDRSSVSRQNIQARQPDTVGQRREQPSARQSDRQSSLGDRQEDRQDWADDAREDRQDAARERQEDRQDFIEDEYDDRWDHYHWHGDGEFAAGVVVGAAIGAAATSSTTVNYVTVLPCQAATVTVNSTTYYKCDTTWYTRSYSGSQVTYIIASPPPGF